MLLLLFAGFRRRSVGSSISGGTFSRGRWRKLVEERERELAEAELRKRAEKLRRQAEKRRLELAEQERRRAAREAEKAKELALSNALALAHADAAARGVAQLRGIASLASGQQRAAMNAQAAPAVDPDEEEAIALLLLTHGKD